MSVWVSDDTFTHNGTTQRGKNKGLNIPSVRFNIFLKSEMVCAYSSIKRFLDTQFYVHYYLSGKTCVPVIVKSSYFFKKCKAHSLVMFSKWEFSGVLHALVFVCCTEQRIKTRQKKKLRPAQEDQRANII